MRIVLAALLILFHFTVPARAESTAQEITYLLKFIRQSPCTFIRNGSDFDGAAAADHIQAKYDHFKSEIRTAENFIDQAATKSMLSGEPYLVRCADASTIPAADWLRAVLHAHRQERPAEPSSGG